MADRIINSYVKWVAAGQELIGQVTAVKDGVVTVSLPMNQQAVLASDKLADATEKEYTDFVTKAVEQLNKLINKDNTMTISQADLDKANKSVETLEAKVKELEATLATEKAAVEEAKKVAKESEDKMAKCKAELDEIKQAAATEARFNEFKALAAVETIDADAAKAKEKLGKMSDTEYGLAKGMAEAFKKTTDQYQTNLAKLTDQTKTGLTKLTEADQKVADEAKAKADADAAAVAAAKAVEDAKAEKEKVDLSTTATQSDKGSNAFSAAMSKLSTKKVKKIVKDKE